MPFSDITVVSVTGADSYTESSMLAIVRSCEELPNSKGLLISPTRPTNLPSNIRHQACKPFGYTDYSIFMIYGLAQYIDTKYCLIVQNDGWALNGDLWRDEFWDYDYIGAPILTGYEAVRDSLGQIQLNTYPVTTESILQKGPLCPEKGEFPLNGGFSLRSKRFLEMPRKLGLSMQITPPNVINSTEPFKFDWGAKPVHSEDLFLTVGIRKELENAGMKFAPYVVANEFSVESTAVRIFTGKEFTSHFGHHLCTGVKIYKYDRVEFPYQKKFYDEYGVEPLRDVFEMFTTRGYHVDIKLI